MSWNYRVIQEKRQVRGRRVTTYNIREVYYDKKDNPRSYTKDPITLGGFDSKSELLITLSMMMRDALRLPILCLSHKKERLFLRGKK